MKTAMILAAGRGERLRPITDKRPKALCCVRNIPVIERHVVNLAVAGFERLIINHAYLGGQIRHHLGTGERWNINIIYAPEPPGALETGGALVNILPLLDDEPFVLVNADIFTDYDFKNLSLKPSFLAHVILVEKPLYFSHADYGLTDDSQLSNNNRIYTYSGITCLHPQLIETLAPGRFSITPLMRQWADNQMVSGEVYRGKWQDIGTIERLTEISG